MKKEILMNELKIYEKALQNAKNPFEKSIFEFEIACVKKDLAEKVL